MDVFCLLCSIHDTLQGLKGDFRYVLWPILYEGSNYIIAFDFRYLQYIPDNLIVDEKKYKVLFRTQHRFFADIIQKSSSYSARLGNNLLFPVVENPEKAR